MEWPPIGTGNVGKGAAGECLRGRREKKMEFKSVVEPGYGEAFGNICETVERKESQSRMDWSERC